MDLVCVRCGEPWELDYVLHGTPDDFIRSGGLIRRCPSCPATRPTMNKAEQQRLAIIATLARAFGNDIDALAATLADSKLV